AAGARHRQVGRHVGHAHLQTLHFRAGGEGAVGGGVARAVIGGGDDVVAAFLLVALGQRLVDVALGVGQQVLGIAEGVGVVGDADARETLGGEAGAGNDHVHRAQRQALVDVVFLAELRGRVNI